MSDDQEATLRDRLRRIIDGAPVEEQPQQPPLVQVHVIAEPTAPDDDEDQEDDEPEEEPEKDRPWWYVRPGPFGLRTPDPVATPQDTIAAAPGIHVTVNQPPPQLPWAPPIDRADAAAAERLHRRRIWVAYHAGAAGVGWYFGAVHAMADLIADAGPAGPGAGAALALVTYVVASYLPGLPYIPPALRPVIVWAARIPVSSAVLALCLNAPGIA